jgi:nucleotide-binding universal stress UspA family protein
MSGLIVVGVDGSQASVDALEWAATQARFTGFALEVVMAWEFPVSFGWAPPWPSDFNPEKEAYDALGEVVNRVVGSGSGIEVRQTVVEGHPAPVLLKASEGADLLVVGSRGHGAFAGMLLGSVSEHCASHATCPVVVVRHRAHETE